MNPETSKKVCVGVVQAELYLAHAEIWWWVVCKPIIVFSFGSTKQYKQSSFQDCLYLPKTLSLPGNGSTIGHALFLCRHLN
jgi:hypothetical protein